jgi:hypothetical protein
MQGDAVRAKSCFAQALALGRDLGDKGRIREMLDHVAILAASVGDDRAGARFIGAAGAMLEQVGGVRPPDTQREVDAILPHARGLAKGAQAAWTEAEAAWTEAEAEGRALSEPQAVEAALGWLGAESIESGATLPTVDP